MKKNLIQRVLCTALSVVMAASSVVVAAADNDDIVTYGTVYHANQKLQKQSQKRIPFLTFNGAVDYDNFVPMQVAWTNPATKDVYQAYCINPAYPGYGDVADYGIDIEKFDNDCIVDAGGSGGNGKTAGSKSAAGNTIAAFLEGAVNYGYPTVDAATLLGGSAADYGVSQEELNYAAYLATKMAIWSGIHTNYSINSWNVNNNLTGYSVALKNKVLAATKSVYNKAGSYTPASGESTVTFTAGEPALAGSSYEVPFTIGNTQNNVEGADMYVEMAAGGTFTNGIVIQSADGTPLNKTTTSGGDERYIVPAGTTEVKAVLPNPGEESVTAELRLYAKQKKKILLYGRSTKSATQGYVLAGNHYDNPTDGFVINAETPGVPPTTDTPRITVEKYDEKTGEKLPNAQFAIYEQDDMSRPVKEGMTDANGKLTTGKLKAGTYVVKELNPPKGYMVSDKTKAERVIVVKNDDGEIVVKVDNIKLPELKIKKVDAITKEPVAGVTYEVKLVDDTSVQPATAVTDANGTITLPELKAGTYEVTEISAPKSYIVNKTSQRVKLEGGDEKTLLFENTKYPTLIVKKTDATTNKGIPNTTYKIEHEKADGTIEAVGTFKTDANGQIKLPNVETGWYILTETIPAQGYQKPTNPVTRIYLKAGDNAYTPAGNHVANGNLNNAGAAKAPVITSGTDYEKVGDIVNYPLNSIVIKKSDANTGEMLEGATFEVIKTTGETSGQNGTVICTVTTDHSGVIVITGLEAGAYAVREIKAPKNYIIDETNLQTVNLKADGTSVVEVVFRNYPYGSIHIQKTDGKTKQPLEGAEFKVTESNGAFIGNFTTDANGEILIPNLKPGSYLVTEAKAPDGYALSAGCAKTVVIGTDGKVQNLNFTNYKKLGVQIIKIDSETRQPLQGAEFQIWNTGASSSTSVAAGTPAGVLVGTYTTDINGVINVVLDAGTYEILETKAPKGYQTDKHKQDIVVKDGEQTSVTFTNTKLPDGTILIHKTDAKTGDAIEGGSFEIRKENGELIATEETDKQGEITVSGLEKGTYYVKETKAKEGYKADNKSHKVVLGKSGYVKLEVENTPLAGLRLKKIDSITGEGIYGVEFALYDKNGKIVGNYFTDNKGVIDFEDELPEGRYTIKEITPADGYYSDTKPRTVELRAGKVTQITWENTPQAGQIKIKKVSGDYNETNALPKGTALQGAIFEIYNYKTRNVVDRIVTDYYGIANSKPLPLGRYIIKEVQAPSYYKINPEEIDVTIEFATQVVKLTVENYSANISVGIDKFGPYEVMQGQSAIYTIKNVRNSSTVPLNDFYWRDLIPTSAGTVEKIITGTYNMPGRYKVVATTSAGNTKVLADNLDTAKNNVILCSPAAVGLRSGESITSVSLMFGTVQPGFTQVLDAKVYMNIKRNGLPSNYQFANKADVGGKYGNEWATGNSTWVTSIYNPAKQRLPKTGW